MDEGYILGHGVSHDYSGCKGAGGQVNTGVWSVRKALHGIPDNEFFHLQGTEK